MPCSSVLCASPSKILREHISRRVSRADFSRKWKYAHVVVQFYILGFNLIHSLFFNVVLSSGLTLPRNFSVRTYVKIVRQLKSAFIRVPYQQIHGQAGCKEKEKFKYWTWSSITYDFRLCTFSLWVHSFRFISADLSCLVFFPSREESMNKKSLTWPFEYSN